MSPDFILFGSPEVNPTDKELDPAIVLEGDPAQKVWLYGNEASAGSRYGMWDCQSGTQLVTMDGIVEFCCIIEGEAEITNLEDGSVRTVKAGDAFLMQEGLKTKWRVEKYIKKFFAITDTK